MPAMLCQAAAHTGVCSAYYMPHKVYTAILCLPCHTKPTTCKTMPTINKTIIIHLHRKNIFTPETSLAIHRLEWRQSWILHFSAGARVPLFKYQIGVLS